MIRYTAMIDDDSIEHAREVDCGTIPSCAFDIAEREFCNELPNHEIVIYAKEMGRPPWIFARRPWGKKQQWIFSDEEEQRQEALRAWARVWMVIYKYRNLILFIGTCFIIALIEQRTGVDFFHSDTD